MCGLQVVLKAGSTHRAKISRCKYQLTASTKREAVVAHEEGVVEQNFRSEHQSNQRALVGLAGNHIEAMFEGQLPRHHNFAYHQSWSTTSQFPSLPPSHLSTRDCDRGLRNPVGLPWVTKYRREGGQKAGRDDTAPKANSADLPHAGRLEFQVYSNPRSTSSQRRD